MNFSVTAEDDSALGEIQLGQPQQVAGFLQRGLHLSWESGEEQLVTLTMSGYSESALQRKLAEVKISAPSIQVD